jgi:hypothetical protein
MFRTGSFFLRLLGFLVLVGLLIAGGALIYQAGQNQGYLLGQAAAGAEAPAGVQPAPLAPGYLPYYYYRPHFGFFPFGGFFGLFLGALLIFFLLRLVFWPRHWGYHGWGHRYGGWHDHPHEWGGPPWSERERRGESGEAEKAGSPDKPPDEYKA